MQQSALGSVVEHFSAPAKAERVRLKKAAVERRSERKIRFTAAEWRLVEERARACGRATARYVREVAVGAVPKISRTRGNAPIIRELGAIAGALQELKGSDSRNADSTESDMNARVDALVSRVLGVVDRLT